MKVKEVLAKSILNESSIGDYCINVYIGCQHACRYCYADYYTRKIYGIKDSWGTYVFAKINAPSLLLKEIKRKKKGIVYISSLSDPYQPIEEKYKLTRKILEILLSHDWPIIVQTKSTLVLRDLDLLERFSQAEVGFTIITLDEKIRERLEPYAPPIAERIRALKILKEKGIKVFAFLGPIPPYTPIADVERLIKAVDFVDKIFIDKLNYKPGLENNLLDSWFKADEYYRELKLKLEGKEKIIFVY